MMPKSQTTPARMKVMSFSMRAQRKTAIRPYWVKNASMGSPPRTHGERGLLARRKMRPLGGSAGAPWGGGSVDGDFCGCILSEGAYSPRLFMQSDTPTRALYERYVVPTYGRFELSLARGL